MASPTVSADLDAIRHLADLLAEAADAAPAAVEAARRAKIELPTLDDDDGLLEAMADDVRYAAASGGDRGAHLFIRRHIHGARNDDWAPEPEVALSYASFLKRFVEAEPALWSQMQSGGQYPPDDAIEPALRAVERLTAGEAAS